MGVRPYVLRCKPSLAHKNPIVKRFWMKRRFFFGLLPLFFYPAVVRGAIHISGTLKATDQEAQEGYFSIGRNIMVTARPESDEHRALREMVGKDVNLSVF